MTNTDTLRSTDLQNLVTVLKDQHARRLDAVVPASALTATSDGKILLGYTQPATITDDGVTPEQDVLATFDTTRVAEEHLSEKLQIPIRYFDRCRVQAPHLWADNVNHWLSVAGEAGGKFYVRTLQASGDQPGIMRAVLSDRFRAIDNIDVTMAILDGIRKAPNVDPSTLTIGCDLTARRMQISITAPTVAAEVADLVENYRRPGGDGTRRNGRDYPLMWAGVVFRNSDVGEGAFVGMPRFVFQVCTNGMTRTQDAIRAVHVGGKQAEGVVDWSETTQRKTLELIASQTTDAVRTFLSPEYLATVVAEMRSLAGVEIGKPADVVKVVTAELKFTQDEQESILDAFIAGGDNSPLGVAQAITWTAQNTANPDRASEMEDVAWRAATRALALA